MSNALAQASATYLPWIEEELRSILASPAPHLDPYYGMMRYHMGWVDTGFQPIGSPAGKRVRPLLCLLACEAAGGDPKKALPAAAGLELLHNFSLLHDDIEDNSPMRRHRPAVWTVYGLAQGINAGDAMFTAAHLAFYRLEDAGVPLSRVLHVLRTFDGTAVALTRGQYLDIAYEARPDITETEYFAMIGGKTAALLAASPEIGAMVAGAGEETARLYRDFGWSLGMAFQLQDDVLGLWGDEKLTGKSAITDVLTKKKSLPVVHALADPGTGQELRALYAGPSFTEQDVPRVMALLNGAGARAYAEQQARAAADRAYAALDALTARAVPGAMDALRQYLDQMLERQA